MELQPTTDFPPEPTRNSARDEDTPLPAREQELSASFPLLQFPKPQGSQHLANWVSNSTPAVMQPSDMSDTSSLADSAYEVVHGTDSESQDDRLTESVGSLSVSRPEDVHSLDGSENHYDTDSDEETNHSSHASSIRYADHALQHPSAQGPASSLDHASFAEGSGVVVGSIELQEATDDGSLLREKILAKHAIREFSEEESTAMVQHLNLSNPPKRLVASIRQTMSQSYLSTREPLRVLYVGRADAQRSIVLKICSAIWTSPKNGASDDQDHFSRHREGVYNIVPISSFGPAPELDLMEASHYQIKVEHCTSAAVLSNSVYSVTLEHERSYTSSYSSDGPVVRPKWDLPHIAIFYCSERDDAETELTRDSAWAFMKLHGVPCIMIAEQQQFSDSAAVPWEAYINEDTIHLSLESRDPQRPMPPLRFPIDYASFAEIDPRQMNRNLAYLTGLSDKAETTTSEDGIGATEAILGVSLGESRALDKLREVFCGLAERHDAKWWILTLLGPFLLSLTVSFFLSAFAGWLRSGDLSHLQPASPTGICVSPPTYPKGFTTKRMESVATSTTTVVVNVTSTRTVQVSQGKPSTSALASALSFAGFLSDKPSAAPTDADAKTVVDSTKKTVCSVRVFSPTELLVALPSRNKAVWLAQGAIDIDVRRSDEPIKIKISSVDEGVVVELPPREAYGVLNVSVVTSRRPKVNETFQVDFGKSAAAQALEAGLDMLQDAVRMVSTGAGAASHLIEDALKLRKDFVCAVEHASEAAWTRAAGRVKRTADDVREHVARQFASAQTIRKEVDLSILQAQIASRLWWLKVLGKDEEYVEYARNASRLLKAKHAELAKGRRQAKETRLPKETFSSFGLRTGLYRPWRKRCARGAERGQDTADSRNGRWSFRWKQLMAGGGV
ncbi:a6d3146e-9639-435a-aee9-da249c56125c [Thermothielavioides terrestris]|uniref:A6d3146e-9639-435a-aee9-da249c56125c n=1 Tax=Thermothielavioides terrestris TaxID=2587410 RepID=A0A446BKC0_9PEZI|nr:a6d3146e-9639-435a-aee9-da249c56125c [Thermothielavioides terrestris]